MKTRPLFLIALAQAGLLTIAACDTGSPTQPSPPVQVSAPAALVGEWRGLFEITGCSGQAGDCDSQAINEFQLTVVPSVDGLKGVLVLLDDDRTTVDVTARMVDGRYQFSASGYDVVTNATWPVRTVVSAIDLRTDPAAGLIGSMIYTNTTFRSYSRTIAIRSAVATAARRPRSVPRGLAGLLPDAVMYWRLPSRRRRI